VQQATGENAREKLAYSIKESTEQLGLSRAYINTLIARGELRYRKVGRRVLIPRDALLEFLEGKK
jgi:excisionase family DNA binding protein